MHFEIRIGRPFVTLLAVGAMVGGLAWMQWQDHVGAAESGSLRAELVTTQQSSSMVQPMPVQQVPVAYPGYPMMMPYPVAYPMMMGQQPMGMAPVAQQPYGNMMMPAPTVTSTSSAPADGVTRTVQSESTRLSAEQSVRVHLIQQEILARREELLKGQLTLLEQEMKARGTLSAEERETFLGSIRELTSLLADRLRSEQLIKDSLTQMWEAEEDAKRITQDDRGPAAGTLRLRWPADPIQGISAYFHDPSYYKHFKFQHDAVDIPVAQGSPVKAAADGIVVKVRDNGYGYNSITVQHAGGVSTLYGHVSRFLVAEGDAVKAGQSIALSGGRPGTLGAGLMTTGPHLHFSVFKNGQAVDPLPFLTPVSQYVR